MCDRDGQDYKRLVTIVSSNGTDVKEVVLIFTQLTRVRIRLLARFFLPFQMSYRIEKAFIFNKIKEIIKQLKIKDRVGLG